MTLLPLARTIDYGDADEIRGYQLLACKIYEREGGLSCPSAVRREGREWLAGVRGAVDAMLGRDARGRQGAVPPPSSLPKLLESYDLFHRVCLGTPDRLYVSGARLAAAGRYAAGHREVGATGIALMLLEETRCGTALERRFADYASQTVGGWVDELRFGGRLCGVPPAEAFARLRYLAGADLAAYLGPRGQAAEKRRWVAANMVADLGALDTPTLGEYSRFLLAASAHGLLPGIGPGEDSLRATLLRALASRPDLHPFSRRAIGLDLAASVEAK